MADVGSLLLSQLGRPEDATNPAEYVGRAVQLFYNTQSHDLDESDRETSPQLGLSLGKKIKIN